MNLGVLVSGEGTNLQAILDAGLPVTLVVADRPGAGALARAEAAGVATAVVDRAAFFSDRKGLPDRTGFLPDRAGFSRAVTEALQGHGVELVAMAGFMTVLDQAIFDAYPDRVVNTHPSLLPAFRGATAVADALAAGVRVSGCTIHLATLEVDAGPILAQEAVPVLPGDTRETLHDRIKAVEHRLYPDVLGRLLGRAVISPADPSPGLSPEPTRQVPEPTRQGREATDAALGGRTPVRRALLSVSDRRGLVGLGRALADLGVELVASGGTARTLADAGLPVVAVEAVTEAREMLDGRVKTLHPRIHGGILADRGKPEHLVALEEAGGRLIDLVVVNLYPFRESPSIGTIDVGGPAMVRAAAKNAAWVGVVSDPDQYPGVLDELAANGGTLGAATRARLAAEAFALTAAYDAAIAAWLAPEESLPRHLALALEREGELRYGENPHQRAARYRNRNAPPSWLSSVVRHGGKELSYVNLLDAAAAWELVHDFSEPAAVIVKHANPCGVALGAGVADAYRRALAGDPLSAFGGVVALNRPLDVETATAVAEVFTEVLLAPAYEPGAREVLSARKGLRLLEAPTPGRPRLQVRQVGGEFLVQEPDVVEGRESWKVVTRVEPTEAQWRDLEFAWRVCAAVGSNAIVLVRDGQAVGIGAGQQSRVHAAELAGRKAAGRGAGGVCASDAFFPFRDGVDAAVEAGVRAVIQPGGSVRDEEVVAAADEHGVAMVLTGRRHFRH